MSLEGHNAQIAHQELIVVDSQPSSLQPLLVGGPHGKSPNDNPHVGSGQALSASTAPHIGIVLSLDEANFSRVSTMPIAISKPICDTVCSISNSDVCFLIPEDFGEHKDMEIMFNWLLHW
uniref:Uncharacterized protein n=1 Tax=Populus davidiana TaxID=266767 RepID=A0A6M2EIM7_9ROSI